MYPFPLNKYKFYQSGNKTIAVSSYAGRSVRGVATCNPQDEFSLEKGQKLAAARCAEKISRKRFKRAQKEYLQAAMKFTEAKGHFEKMEEYMYDAYYQYFEATQLTKNLLDEM